eukprot:Sdes_comp23321_c0_seq1m21593
MFHAKDRRRVCGPTQISDLPSSFPKVASENPLLLNGTLNRPDGRSADLPRDIFMKVGVVKQASGSAYLEATNTKVLCSIFGPKELKIYNSLAEFSETCHISCQISFAPFSKQGSYLCDIDSLKSPQ